MESMLTCPECKRENAVSAKICTYCGAPLTDLTEYAATRTLEEEQADEGHPRWGTARFGNRMDLVLRVQGTQKKFVYDAEELTEVFIGRTDIQSGFAPEIDLADYGAAEKGVSRRHAAIIRRDGSLHIKDLGARNGTFLNGQKLVPEQPRVLRDGDEIRLGRLVLEVHFHSDLE